MGSFLFNSLLSNPYYEGGGTSSLSTQLLTDVALSGHGYNIDFNSEIPLRHVSVPILRQQQDTSKSPGEQSINPEGLWRRVGESWHVGAGQERFDREDSNPYRFRESKGINIWEKWELSLLHDTDEKFDTAATNLRLAVAGSYLYACIGNTIRYTQDITPDTPSFTSLTGIPAVDPTSITSNGNRIWTSHGASGIYMTTRGGAATASHITGTVALVDYVKNRVMAANGPSIYDVTALAVGAGGALPAVLFTHGNTDWNWVAFAESQGFIYVAGYSGDKSLIYSLGITTDGTALSAPVVAGALPDGEVVTALYGYLGRFLAIGSNKGFRLAFIGQDGGLSIGSLIATPASVLCFEGQEEFIWYGLTNFDATSSGLGRLSTTQFSDLDNFVPAYASDIMASAVTAAVQSVVTFQNLRVFGINGQGIYAEEVSKHVVTGYLDTGQISYGLTELKMALYLDIQTANNGANNGSIELYLAVDGNTFDSLGAYYTNGLIPTFNVAEEVGNEFEIRLSIDRDTVNTSLAPSILSWLLRVQPRPVLTHMILATISLAPVGEMLTDAALEYDTATELEFLENLSISKEVVIWQELLQSYSVVVDDYELNIMGLIFQEGMSGFNGSCTLKLKRV